MNIRIDANQMTSTIVLQQNRNQKDLDCRVHERTYHLYQNIFDNNYLNERNLVSMGEIGLLVERLLENDELDGTMSPRWSKYDFISISSLSRNFVPSSSFKVNQREKLDEINLMTLNLYNENISYI
jgi:hypothetical protein